MPRCSAPLWQAGLSTSWSSQGARVFYREPGSGRQPEQVTNSSLGLILRRESSRHPNNSSDCSDVWVKTRPPEAAALMYPRFNKKHSFVLLVEAPCGFFCSIQVGVLLLLPPWQFFLSFLIEQHLFWCACTWRSCGINTAVLMADTENVRWGLEFK